jgi:hypothetical protein
MDQASLDELRAYATNLLANIRQYETLVAAIQMTNSQLPRGAKYFDQQAKNKIIQYLQQAISTLDSGLTPPEYIKPLIFNLKTAVEKAPVYVEPQKPKTAPFTVVKHIHHGRIMHHDGGETSIDYYVRQYPAGDPGGEYQKWGNNGRVYECDRDGNELKPAPAGSGVDMTPLQAHQVTEADIFQDIRDLATKARPADGTPLAPVIEQKKRDFDRTYDDGRYNHDIINAYAVLKTLVEQIKQDLAPSDKDSFAVAEYLITFCNKHQLLASSGGDPNLTLAQRLQAHLNQYYTQAQAPLRLKLAGLKRLNKQ